MRVILGYPLSVYKITRGTYIRFREKNTPKGYIIGAYEQRPDLLLYSPKAILVTTGGVLSHLAAVCREHQIPLYRVKSIDDLVDGEEVMIIPIKRMRVRIEDSKKYTLRIITENPESRGRYLRRVYTVGDYVSRKYGLKVKLIPKGARGNILYYTVEVSGFAALLDQMLKDPDKYIESIKEDLRVVYQTGIPIGVYLIELAEVMVHYLADKYGYDRVLKAIPVYSSVWRDTPESYYRIRFGIEDKSIIKAIRELSSKSNRVVEPLENEKDQKILELAVLIFNLYEAKNLEPQRS